jgi:hypothetical protein
VSVLDDLTRDLKGTEFEFVGEESMRLLLFVAKIDATSATGCWNWTGHVTIYGYGQFWNGERKVYAHRHSYETFVGPIPEGLDIDHLCRNRRCVNFLHMEPVTRQVNLLRGETFPAARAAQTHCFRGHSLSEDNLYITPSTGSRQCQICRKENYRRWVKENRERRRELDRAHYYRKIGRAP